MCGILGFMNKKGTHDQLGVHMYSMLNALTDRGPDSVGVALYHEQTGSEMYRISVKLPAHGTAENNDIIAQITDSINPLSSSIVHTDESDYLQFIVADTRTPSDLEQIILEAHQDVEVVSLGTSLEIVKQVGTPEHLEATFGLRAMSGTHAIGHTRLSTESKIDLSHSQPFWAHGEPDIATVHNGHITNYHKLRRLYEQQGVHFYTENDSEVIGIFLHDRMSNGSSFEDALEESITYFDGSFCYLATTANKMAFVKDRFGLKPLMVAETNEYIAIATEARALSKTFGEELTALEPPPGTMKVWTNSVMLQNV